MDAQPRRPSGSGNPSRRRGKERLLALDEAAALLDVSQDDLWQLLDEAAVRVHGLSTGAGRRPAVALEELLQLTQHPRLRGRARLRVVPPEGGPPPSEPPRVPGLRASSPSDVRDRLAFELEVLRAHHVNLRRRAERLEGALRDGLAESDALREALEEERRRHRDVDGHGTSVAEAGERLAEWRARAEALEDELSVARLDREWLAGELAARERDVETLRAAADTARETRERLTRELELATTTERAAQAYADRLEERLRRMREGMGLRHVSLDG